MCHDHDTFLDTEKVCQECQITFVFDWLTRLRYAVPLHRQLAGHAYDEPDQCHEKKIHIWIGKYILPLIFHQKMLKLSKKKLDCSFWSIFRIREIRNENWKLFELEVRNVKT